MEVIDIVSKVTGVSKEDITGESQKGNISQARHLVCYFESERNKKTPDHIASIVNRNRSTVISSTKVIHYRLAARDKRVLELASEICLEFME